jgi:alkyldihydroxyacetonephosphate synthase
MTAKQQPGERRRRIGAWGFEGEEFAPGRAMRRWLAERLGETERLRAVAPEAVRLAPPRALPALPAATASDALDRLRHARGQGLADVVRVRAGAVPAAPDAVVRPADGDEVEAVLAACSAASVRVVPWGGGTSVTGGVNAPGGDAPAIALDLEWLSGLVRLDADSELATFAAGTFGPRVEADLAPHGLTLGHFPQSWELSTLGGWAVTRSSGQESLGAGGIAELVAGLELRAPAGRLSLAAMPASAAGPDLRQFVLGSEGRLGVVTELTVRVRPRPAERRAEGWLLPSWAEGAAAVRELVRGGAPLSLLRLSDPAESELAMAIGLGGHAWAPLARRWLRRRGAGPDSCLLLAGAAGDRVANRAALAAVRAVARRRRAVSLGAGPGRRWLADRFRHPYLRDALLDLGIATDTLETAASWSALDRIVAAVRAGVATAGEAMGERVAVLCHLSHPYRDGASLYFTLFFGCPADAEEAVARWAALKRAATAALAGAGGTLSHHHGVGSWHAPWYAGEVGEAGVRVVAAAARELDPAGVLNPHVLLDPTDRLEA